MPRTTGSIVENHRVATERRKAGRPVWGRTVKIKSILKSVTEGEQTPAEGGKAIAAVLWGSSWMVAAKREHDDERMDEPELVAIADEMEDIEDLDHLALVMDGLYDLADADRVWIA